MFKTGNRDKPVLEYRVTKYDPALRDASGAYKPDEWTSVRDIGASFGGLALAHDEYQQVEDAYVAVALAFLREAEVAALTVGGLENHHSVSMAFGEGSVLSLEQVGETIRQMLREEFWCRLHGEQAFIHVGWDYYMYIGVPRNCPKAESLARRLGLFVEPFGSPYRESCGD